MCQVENKVCSLTVSILFLQVPLSAESLNSNDVFVLFIKSSAFIWAGKVSLTAGLTCNPGCFKLLMGTANSIGRVPKGQWFKSYYKPHFEILWMNFDKIIVYKLSQAGSLYHT